MKLTVLKWFTDELVPLLGKTIEILFRITLFFLPLGLYLLLIQARGKASKVSNISVYTTEESVWQHIFPGFILVSVAPDSFKKSIILKRNKFQAWFSSNKYTIEAIVLILVLLLLYLGGVK